LWSIAVAIVLGNARRATFVHKSAYIFANVALIEFIAFSVVDTSLGTTKTITTHYFSLGPDKQTALFILSAAYNTKGNVFVLGQGFAGIPFKAIAGIAS